MDLNPRLLSFLKHEMEQIKDDKDRPGEDRKHASSVLGRIEGEIEMNKESHEEVNAKELFS